MSYISNPNSYFSSPDPAFALGIAPARPASVPPRQPLLPTPPAMVLYPTHPVVFVPQTQSPRMPHVSRAALKSLQAARAAWARRAQSSPLEGRRIHLQNARPGPVSAHRSTSVHPSTQDSPSPQVSPSPEEHAQAVRIMEIRRSRSAGPQPQPSEAKDVGMEDASSSPTSDRQQREAEPFKPTGGFFDTALAGIELMLQDCQRKKSLS